MRKIAAIALLTFRSASRSRALAAAAAAIAALTLMLPLVIKGDGTPGSQVGIFINYSLGLLMFFTSLTATWSGAGAISLEIGGKQMQLLVSKPVNAIQLWAGKWIGIMALNFALLALGGALIYAVIQLAPGARGAPGDGARDTGRDVMTVYRTVEPSGAAPEPAAVGPGQSCSWQFDLASQSGLDRAALLKYRFVPSPFSHQSPVAGEWRISADGYPLCQAMKQPASPNMVSYLRLPAPGNARTLRIEYRNGQVDPAVTVFFPAESAPELLIPISSFEANLLRALVMLLARLAFFTSLGMIAGTLFSFPVAVFASMGLLVTAYSGGFVSQVAEKGLVRIAAGGKSTGLANVLDEIIRGVFRVFKYALAPVERFNPLDYLPDGICLTWSLTLQSMLVLFCFYPLLLLAAGAACLRRREVGLVSE